MRSGVLWGGTDMLESVKRRIEAEGRKQTRPKHKRSDCSDFNLSTVHIGLVIDLSEHRAVYLALFD